MTDTLVHLTATCSFCGSHTEITASGVEDMQPILCSLCSGPLGTVGALRDDVPERPVPLEGHALRGSAKSEETLL